MNLFRFFLIAALLLWQPYAPAFAQEEIRFNKGQTTGIVREEIISTIKTWQFRVQKGQRITITLAPTGGDKDTLTMTLYAYCGEEFRKPLASESLQGEG
jgi:reverse gyrase